MKKKYVNECVFEKELECDLPLSLVLVDVDALHTFCP